MTRTSCCPSRADFIRRGAGRRGKSVQRNHRQYPWSRARGLASVFLRPGGRRLVPRRSARPGHVLRQCLEAA
jgi:hypothetical protein